MPSINTIATKPTYVGLTRKEYFKLAHAIKNQERFLSGLRGMKKGRDANFTRNSTDGKRSNRRRI